MGQKIPILMTGHSINEAKTNYRIELLCDNKKSSKANLFIGYGKRLLKNPSYFISIKTLYYQFLDFLAEKGRKGKTNLAIIKPFYYIEWNEDTVVPKILELGWKFDDKEFKSTWRADCYIGVLRQFFYKQELGFNDLDAYYAHLLRNKEISMSEAMERIRFENENNEDLVRSILRDFYDVDYDIVKKKMNK